MDLQQEICVLYMCAINSSELILHNIVVPIECFGSMNNNILEHYIFCYVAAYFFIMFFDTSNILYWSCTDWTRSDDDILCIIMLVNVLNVKI